MIEIVFDKNLKSGLLIAQSFGKGVYREAGIGIVLEENQVIGKKDMQEVIQLQQEKVKEEWEEGILLGGNCDDIFCFDLNLSIGEISEDVIGKQRQYVREQLLSMYGMVEKSSFIQQIHTCFEVLSQRMSKNEPVRIWYSHNPDELCGLYWFLYMIRDLKHGHIYMMKLPDFEYDENQDVFCYKGWGEVLSENIYKYLCLQEEVTDAFITGCALQWEMLKEDNAPLRVELNGKLVSADEDIYDRYICQELDKKNDDFYEHELIGSVLVIYQLGISDSWIKIRINEMIKNGKIEVVSEDESGKNEKDAY